MEKNITMSENLMMIRDPNTFFFNFDWSKLVDENLKHELYNKQWIIRKKKQDLTTIVKI